MRYVIVRDDDTNALTPADYLERLYRPFLERSLPVNLATIPNVRTDVTYGKGIPEGFLVAKNGTRERLAAIGSNRALVDYLLANPGYRIVQHGYNHEFVDGNTEFDHSNRLDIIRRLEEGRRFLAEAGLGEPETFVAPYDRLTPTSLREVAQRFRVLSSGWYELRRLPLAWLPRYAWKKARRKPHWRAGRMVLLTHPGCHLSYHRPYGTMLDEIKRSIQSRTLTVLVTHWWEFFRENRADEPFIRVLHDAAEYLANDPEVRVVSFEDVVQKRVPLN